jgi:hypothetical protein
MAILESTKAGPGWVWLGKAWPGVVWHGVYDQRAMTKATSLARQGAAGHGKVWQG